MTSSNLTYMCFIIIIIFGKSAATQASTSTTYEQVENVLMPSQLSISFSQHCSSQLKAAAVCLQASLAKCKAVLYDSSTLLCDFFNRSLKHDLQQAGTSTTLIYIEITTGAIQNNTNATRDNETTTKAETSSTTEWITTTPPPVYSDCQAYHDDGYRADGVYTLTLSSGAVVVVRCEFDTSNGWTVIQRREDGRQNFDLLWADYRSGFGDVNNEFWLGNDNIHILTLNGNRRLHIDMTDTYGYAGRADYSYFYVSDEASAYILGISGFSGTRGDSLSYHNGQRFSTPDYDNDNYYDFNCAAAYTGGWWYDDCHFSNLNGVWEGNPASTGMGWMTWNQEGTGRFSKSVMKVTRT